MGKHDVSREDGVSPVVGVMLMLVVTIIIAAVVSGFSGGLMGGSSQKAPTMSMDIKVSNTGSWVGSGFSATVTGISESISTSKIKIVTSWKAKNPDYGNVIVGGGVSVGQIVNQTASPGKITSAAPFGFGPGVTGTKNLIPPYDVCQQFGNYSLTQGTGLIASPAGASTNADNWGSSSSAGYGISTPYSYGGYTDEDPATLVLGKNWQYLRPGDVVTVNVIYVPSGKVILSKDVTVTG